MGPGGGAPIVGIAPMMGPYGGYKGDSGDWQRSMYPAPRDEGSYKEFSLRFVCPTSNIGGVIGKGGTIINQIRQESGAGIKVDSSATEGDDCLITVSAREVILASSILSLRSGIVCSRYNISLQWIVKFIHPFCFSTLMTRFLQSSKQHFACSQGVVRKLKGIQESSRLRPAYLCPLHGLAALLVREGPS